MISRKKTKLTGNHTGPQSLCIKTYLTLGTELGSPLYKTTN